MAAKTFEIQLDHKNNYSKFILTKPLLLKMGQSRPLFVYFSYFLITISIIQIEKREDGVLGILIWGRRMVGADKTTELWRPHKPLLLMMAFRKGVKLRFEVYLKCLIREKSNYVDRAHHLFWAKVYSAPRRYL